MKRIAILGSTGSIGTQALDVIASNPSLLKVNLLTANQNADLLIAQALKFMPLDVVIVDKTQYKKVKEALAHLPINVHAGAMAIMHLVAQNEIDIVLTAMVGFAGLSPTIAAIKASKKIALANKETLVVAGDLIMPLARQHGAEIIPVDSEHSAIFQCLVGEEQNPIEKIILTASGGPFRGKDKDFLRSITKREALKHPNWVMGAKITIDSASLMNKGLEVIEAKWLFDLSVEQIDVVVHPQSIIHSLVQFQDGSIKAQLGLPDMKLPIQYALMYPQRLKNDFPRFSFSQYRQLDFDEPDKKTFRNLELAFQALDKGGNMPCILNAANEIAVAKFLNDEIGFLQMSDMIEYTMDKSTFVAKPNLEDYMQTDQEARQVAQNYLSL